MCIKRFREYIGKYIDNHNAIPQCLQATIQGTFQIFGTLIGVTFGILLYQCQQTEIRATEQKKATIELYQKLTGDIGVIVMKTEKIAVLSDSDPKSKELDSLIKEKSELMDALHKLYWSKVFYLNNPTVQTQITELYYTLSAYNKGWKNTENSDIEILKKTLNITYQTIRKSYQELINL